MKQPTFPLTVSEQGVSAKIHRFTRTKKGVDYTFYMVDYTLLGKRKQESHSDLEQAKIAASEACKKIAKGEQQVLELRNYDRLIYLRAVDALKESRTPLDIAAAEFAQAAAILNGRATLAQAALEYIARHSSEIEKIKVADAVELLIKQAQTDGKSNLRQRRLRSLLGRFAEAFNTGVHTLTPKMVGAYLAALPVKERTKANHRDMLGFFSRWCVTQGYLPKNNDLLDGVQKYSKRKYGAVEILTPEEMVTLLSHVRDDLLPFIVLCGFAGLRSIEVQRLDWSDIDFEDGYIEVREDTAKQHEGEILRRIVPMPANLKSWLSKVRKPSGRVCPFNTVENHLDNLCEKSGVKWRHNCLRHSAISYRVASTGDIPRVADDSGNSPYVIRKNYLNRRKPSQAAQWFGITPGEAPNTVRMPTPEEAKATITKLTVALPTQMQAAA